MPNFAELDTNLGMLESTFFELWRYLMVQDRQHTDAELDLIHDNLLRNSLIKELAARFQGEIVNVLFELTHQCRSLMEVPLFQQDELLLWQIISPEEKSNALMWLTIKVAEKTSFFARHLSERPARGSRFLGYGLGHESGNLSFADFFTASATVEPGTLTTIISLQTDLTKQIKELLASHNNKLAKILEQLVGELIESIVLRSKSQIISYTREELCKKIFKVAWHDLERNYFRHHL